MCYSAMALSKPTSQVVASDGLALPSGVAISRDSKRLFVSDHATGSVHAYAISEKSNGHFKLLDTFHTPARGITGNLGWQKFGIVITESVGLAIDPQDRIFYADSSQSAVRMINPHCKTAAGCDSSTNPFNPDMKPGMPDKGPAMSKSSPGLTEYEEFRRHHFTYEGCTR